LNNDDFEHEKFGFRLDLFNSKTRDFNLSSCRETKFELANVKRGDTFPFSMKNKWRIDIKIFLKIKKNLETKGHLTSL